MTIKLTRKQVKQGQGCHPWTLEVSAVFLPDETPAPIFVYQTRVDTDNVTVTSAFHNVASLTDMNDTPEGEPETAMTGEAYQDNIPFFRLPTVTVDFHNASELAFHWHWMKKQVCDLVREYNAARNLETEEEVVCE